MEKNRLVELLQTFQKNEWRDLRRFVRSPFFNQNERLARLCDALADQFAAGKTPEKKAIFQQIFDSKIYDDQKMRLAQSDLLRLVEQFLTWQEAAPKNDEQAKIRLAAAYRKRGLARHFEKTIGAARSRLAARPTLDADHHTDRHDLEMEQYQMASSAARTADFNLQEISDSMDAAFLARRLRLACFAQSHAAVWQANYRAGLLPNLLEFLKKNAQLADYPAIGVYFFGYEALKIDGSETDFQLFKNAIFTHADRFPEDELRNLYLLALNFCIKKVNAAEPNYAREALDFYKSGLEKRLFLENGRLSRFAFANIVAIGLRCGEADFVEKFILDFQDFLEKTGRSAAVNLATARLHFHRKNWNDALVALQAADFKDLLSNLIAKILQAKIFYELDEMEVLEAHLATLKMFLRRHPALGYHRQNALDFIILITKIKVLRPKDKLSRADLKQKIEALAGSTERDWLLEKLLDL